MSEINKILSDTNHRPYALPKQDWTYYQEWNNALFLHWQVPIELLRECVPDNLLIDTFDGAAYVSIVIFTMQKIRPKYLPSIQFISDFDEINVRTYVVHDNKQGVYFLNIEAAKTLSVFIAKKLSGLPYEKANMKRQSNSFQSVNPKKDFSLNVSYQIEKPILEKTALDLWLTERYCLYVENGKEMFRYDIHHKAWELKTVNCQSLKLKYTIGKMQFFDQKPICMHYSDGVKVIAWSKNKLDII